MKILDNLMTYGWKITRKRAIKKNPLYAARYAARRQGPHILMLSEDFTMDMWKEEGAIERKHRPWWLVVLLHTHWFLQDWGPRRMIRRIKSFYQRGKRGWADEDAWSLHLHLALVIRDSVKKLKSNLHSWPGEPMTFEEWEKILQEIIDGMQATIDIDNNHVDHEEENFLLGKHTLAMTHLRQYWFHLWD